MIHVLKPNVPTDLNNDHEIFTASIAGLNDNNDIKKKYEELCKNKQIIGYRRKSAKKILYELNKSFCPFCERKMLDDGKNNDRSFTFEHIIPRKYDQSKTILWENLIGACNRCNETRGDKYDSSLYLDATAIQDIASYFSYVEKKDGIEITANTSKCPEDVKCAEEMIKIYDLNDEVLKKERHAFMTDEIQMFNIDDDVFQKSVSFSKSFL